VAKHALITGPIAGRIPIKHKKHPEGHVDVTPDVLLFDDMDHVHAVAAAIEDEHRARGTHPELETGGA
jgi:hypothetical protein